MYIHAICCTQFHKKKMIRLVLTVLLPFWATSIGCSMPREVARLPLELDIHSVFAVSDKLLVIGDRSGSGKSPLTDPRFLVARVTVDRGIETKELGPGLVQDASRVSDGSFVVLTVQRRQGETSLDLRRLVSKVWRSTDEGETWSELPLPFSGCIGVAFESASRGFAWSRDALAHTVDSGLTWKQRSLPHYDGQHVERGARQGTVDRVGRLWLILQDPDSAVPRRAGVLAIVTANQADRLVHPNDETGFTEIVGDGKGGVLVFGLSKRTPPVEALHCGPSRSGDEDVCEKISSIGRLPGHVSESERYVAVITGTVDDRWQLRQGAYRYTIADGSWEAIKGATTINALFAAPRSDGRVWLIAGAADVYLTEK